MEDEYVMAIEIAGDDVRDGFLHYLKGFRRFWLAIGFLAAQTGFGLLARVIYDWLWQFGAWLVSLVSP